MDSNSKKPNKYFSIDDGWGIIGYGYTCEKCGEVHRFCNGSNDEMYCKNCGHLNNMEIADEWK
jgi:hypothetical protein